MAMMPPLGYGPVRPPPASVPRPYVDLAPWRTSRVPLAEADRTSRRSNLFVTLPEGTHAGDYDWFEAQVYTVGGRLKRLGGRKVRFLIGTSEAKARRLLPPGCAVSYGYK